MGIKKLNKKLDSGYTLTIDSKGNYNFGGMYKHDVVRITKDYQIIPKNNNDVRNADAIKLHNDIMVLKESGELKELIEAKDEYEKLIDVYTFDNGKVLKRQCEIPGYPNTTIDGKLMYENTHFPTRKEALIECRKEDAAGLRSTIKWQLPEYITSTKRILRNIVRETRNWLRSHILFGY